MRNPNFVTLKFDVVILGGGPAGTSAAISLLQKGYSVAVIEKTSYSANRIGETVPPQIKGLFTELQINDEILNLNHHLPSYANQSAWGNASVVQNNFFFNPFGNGWHLNRLKFDNQLIEQTEKSGAKVFIDSDIKTIVQNDAEEWVIKFSNSNKPETIAARVAIDATGRNSFLVKKKGGKRLNIDHLIGLVSIQENCLEQKQSNYTLVESTKNGWWYSADLPGDKIIIAYMTDADLYKKEMQSPSVFWQRNLSETKYTKARSIKNNGQPIDLYAAGSFITDRRFGKNWLAIGDAAMAFDPLTSAGIVKGIKDGCNAANALHDFFCGKKKDFKEFADSFEKRFMDYLSQRKKYYLLEKRWKEETFWKRRHD